VHKSSELHLEVTSEQPQSERDAGMLFYELRCWVASSHPCRDITWRHTQVSLFSPVCVRASYLLEAVWLGCLSGRVVLHHTNSSRQRSRSIQRYAAGLGATAVLGFDIPVKCFRYCLRAGLEVDISHSLCAGRYGSSHSIMRGGRDIKACYGLLFLAPLSHGAMCSAHFVLKRVSWNDPW